MRAEAGRGYGSGTATGAVFTAIENSAESTPSVRSKTPDRS